MQLYPGLALAETTYRTRHAENWNLCEVRSIILECHAFETADTIGTVLVQNIKIWFKRDCCPNLVLM